MESPSVYGNAPDVIIPLADRSVLHTPNAGTVQFAEPVLLSEPNPAVIVPTGKILTLDFTTPPYPGPVFGTKLVQSLIGLARISRKTKKPKPL